MVEGAYRVYFEEGSAGSPAVMIQMNEAVEMGMDDGAFVEGNIRNVAWIESPQGKSVGAINNGNTTVRSDGSNGSSTTPIVVGASVGAFALIGLLAFYRRRNTKNNDEDTFTTPPGGTTTA